MSRIILALSLGDPGGIGVEVALKAAYSLRINGLTMVLVGDEYLVARQSRMLGLPFPPVWREEPGSMRCARRLPRVCVWSPRLSLPAPKHWPVGRTGRLYGRLSAEWVKAAVQGCRDGWFDGMVTAPICKKSLMGAGLDFPGHTEYIAALTGVEKYAMMLIGGTLRVALATRHLPLARVSAELTSAGIVEAGVLTARALPWLAVAGRTGSRVVAAQSDRPEMRLAVCALNPHAGDGGMLGDEERRIIAPALRRLRRLGVDVEGPIPADVVFHQAARGKYGAVLAMYHDQGLGPLKTLAFDTGVNLTLGLPIVRTSPDHGTAFDIAGQGRADAGSMRSAIELAARLARLPNPWRLRGE